MVTILIAEDDDNLRLLLSRRLQAHYEVAGARDGREALDMVMERRVDLIVADIVMPRLDGIELLRNVRHKGLAIPVILITANQSFDAKRAGFSSGTDDFLTKPVNCDELLWRIQALLRRARIKDTQRIVVGETTVDSRTYTVTRGDARIELPKKEFELLFKLLSHPRQIFTKNQLMDEIWGQSSESGEETIKTHVSRLRGRLKGFNEISIVSVKGIGYKAEENEGVPNG